VARVIRPLHRERWRQQRHQCLYFPFCLDQAPLTWLKSLDKHSIDKWDQLKEQFTSNFAGAMGQILVLAPFPGFSRIYRRYALSGKRRSHRRRDAIGYFENLQICRCLVLRRCS
jgi:hypothetical protein